MIKTTTGQRFITLLVLSTAALFILFTLSLKGLSSRPKFRDAEFETIPIPLNMIMSGEPIQLPQNDPRIKKFIWDQGFLAQPSTLPYNLSRPNKDPSIGQGQIIRKLFKSVRNGFFVESGALDGETRSNSLFLEKELGWRGLLVEPDPSNYVMLLGKNRKAFTSNACLATKPYPHRATFQQNFNTGRITNTAPHSKYTNHTHYNYHLSPGQIITQCFPLYSLLNALSVRVVDYLSLDIEGAELEVLESFPFHEVFVKTLSIEFTHIPKHNRKERLKLFMEKKGYILVAEVTHVIMLANDYIFVHKSLQDLVSVAKKLMGTNTGAPPGSRIRLLATRMKYKQNNTMIVKGSGSGRGGS